MLAPVVFGHSVQGRPLTAVEVGDPGAPLKTLVVAGIHGDEPGTGRVTRALRDARVTGADVWVVDALNPDGLARHTRTNAHGVDLNRNFAVAWRRAGRGTRYDPGPRPFSEPETRAIRRLILRIRPAVTIWLHQPYHWVYVPPDAPRTARALARRMGLPAHRLTPAETDPGTATLWAADAVRPSVALTVEYGAAAPGATAVRRSVRAILALAEDGPADWPDIAALDPAGASAHLPDGPGL